MSERASYRSSERVAYQDEDLEVLEARLLGLGEVRAEAHDAPAAAAAVAASLGVGGAHGPHVLEREEDPPVVHVALQLGLVVGVAALLPRRTDQIIE